MERNIRRSCKKVVYLIGLPGVGKTTVAGAIAKKTGFVLLDHFTIYKEICCFLPKGKHQAHLLHGQIHLAILKLLLDSKVSGIVYTTSVRRNPTYGIIKSAVRLIKKSNAEVSFVKIECDWKEHKQRIQSPARRKLGKANTIKKLKEYVNISCFEGIKKYPPLIINNTSLSAKKCAEKIISDLKLI